MAHVTPGPDVTCSEKAHQPCVKAGFVFAGCVRAERDEIGKFKMGANISIQFIRSFVTVVNSGGFIRASEELGLSSPTVSLQVKRLEELLGTPLFEKSSRLVLTKAGQSCFECGLKLLAIYDEMLERNAEITQKVPSGDLVSGHE